VGGLNAYIEACGLGSRFEVGTARIGTAEQFVVYSDGVAVVYTPSFAKVAVLILKLGRRYGLEAAGAEHLKRLDDDARKWLDGAGVA
jgi:hypothetical protein